MLEMAFRRGRTGCIVHNRNMASVLMIRRRIYRKKKVPRIIPVSELALRAERGVEFSAVEPKVFLMIESFWSLIPKS